MIDSITITKLSAKQISTAFINKIMHNKPGNRVIPNVYIGKFECDILEITSSDYLYEYEIKISKSDFKADSKKGTKYVRRTNISKYELLLNGKGVNYLYYVVPRNLVSENDLPEWAGLIYVDCILIKKNSLFDNDSFIAKDDYYSYSFTTIKKARLLHKEKVSAKRKAKIFESVYYRFHDYRKKLGL